jgi:putative MATE family efflux protein
MHALITYRNILKVSIPIIISGLSVNIVNITDTIFLSNVGELALGAAGNAGILYYVFVLLGMGFSTGAQIIIGRRNGEERYHEIGSLLNQTMYFLGLLAVLFIFLIKAASTYFLPLVVASQDVLGLIGEYLQMRSWGIVFTLGNLSLISFYVGTTQTRILGIITPAMALLNVLLDYIFIFGTGSIPAMGVEGAALASNISEACGYLALLSYTYFKTDKQKYALFKLERLNYDKIRRILVTAGPIMVQNFITLSSWFVFFSIIENLGERALAISHIVRSLYLFAMIPVFGFGDATNTLVSNLMGQGASGQIIKLLKRVSMISIGANLLMMPVLVFFADTTLLIYSRDIGLIADTIPSLRVVAGSMFVFSLALIVYRAITGIGRTKSALLIEIGSISIYMLYTWYVGVVIKASLPVVWASEFVYFGTMFLISFLFLRFAKWENTEV